MVKRSLLYGRPTYLVQNPLPYSVLFLPKRLRYPVYVGSFLLLPLRTIVSWSNLISLERQHHNFLSIILSHRHIYVNKIKKLSSYVIQKLWIILIEFRLLYWWHVILKFVLGRRPASKRPDVHGWTLLEQDVAPGGHSNLRIQHNL